MKRANLVLAVFALGGCMSAWAIQSIYPTDAVKNDGKVQIDGKFFTANSTDYQNIISSCHVENGAMPTLHNKEGSFVCVRSDGSVSSTVVSNLTMQQLSPVPYVVENFCTRPGC